jgi:hypothetical protein
VRGMQQTAYEPVASLLNGRAIPMDFKSRHFDGEGDFKDAIQAVGYSSASEAVLIRSIFPPPSIVTETKNTAIVNAVRRGSFAGLQHIERRGYIMPSDVERLFGLTCKSPTAPGVYVDDNHCAHTAFLACFAAQRDRWTQLCHVFPSKDCTKDPRYFTCLPNLVLVPAWLAKLTDSSAEVCQTLRYAVRLVYSFCPLMSGHVGVDCRLCTRPSSLRLDEDTMQGNFPAARSRKWPSSM